MLHEGTGAPPQPIDELINGEGLHFGIFFHQPSQGKLTSPSPFVVMNSVNGPCSIGVIGYPIQSPGRPSFDGLGCGVRLSVALNW